MGSATFSLPLALVPVRVCSVGPCFYDVQRIPGSTGALGLSWGSLSAALRSGDTCVPLGCLLVQTKDGLDFCLAE